MQFKDVLDTASGMLFPEGIKCIVCEGELRAETASGLCLQCSLTLVEAMCNKCGRAFLLMPAEGQAADAYICAECRRYPLLFDAARASAVYSGDVKRLVYGLKYGNKRYLARYMAGFMADTLSESDWKPDFITFVPISKKRLKKRGYNQAGLLASALAELTGLKSAGVLDRIRDTKNAARMKREKRFELIQGAITATPGAEFSGQNILLVDDVLTTGATAHECAKALKSAGAGQVHVLTFATGNVIAGKA